MINQRNKLYITTMLVCFFGILWLSLDYYTKAELTICPVKLITGYPCPSCGSTRSISAVLHGDFKSAIMINPLGIVSSLIIIGVLAMLLIDILFKKDYYYIAYYKVERFLQTHKIFSGLLVVIVILNWIWNIQKGL